MGFEQLASLRDELAQQAAAEKQKKRQLKEGGGATTRKTAKVDPVVLIIGQLQKNFPLAFPKNPAPKVPLKIGIHKDIFERSEQLGIDKRDLRAAIKTWCWGKRYWECLLEDAVRVDLDGHAAGQVTKVDADQAIKLKEGRRRTQKTAAEPHEAKTEQG
ncbi:ProQ/FinO family protein [Methylomonas methanica]|uniref:Fertility inhibition FinO-like protein n=1 Tax=Methylomonas methanica (strain DSM 25384 / MC09) TaxID=857087 RepID=G0A3R6_METMM|nr:ProQ/FinO family protein [Methylomonas methanica]AEG01538.1 Fertility inhibition FinO-like protein [Methylomonas methanica MC09]